MTEQRRCRLRGFLTSVFVLTAVLCFSAAADAAEVPDAAAVKIGWQTENGKRCYYGKDGKPVSGAVTVDDTPYLFAPNGAQQVGWQTVGALRYYYDPESGEPVFGFINWRGEEYCITKETGKQTALFKSERGMILPEETGVIPKARWYQTGDAWHYADKNGVAAEKETVIDGVPCLFDSEYALETGWQTASDGITRYYNAAFNPEEPETAPLVCTGWLTDDEKTYYADAEQGMLCGLQKIEDDTYFFDQSGVMQTGFQKTADNTCFFADDGKMQTGWLNLDDTTYYLGESGAMAAGMTEIDGARYLFDADGAMQTGWQIADDRQYYFGTDGKAFCGLQTIGAETYYFDADAVMQTGAQVLADVPYYFDASGKRIDGWHTAEAGKTYTDPMTGKQVTGWKEIGANRYYFSEAGIMAAGMTEIDGKMYRFQEDGVYKPVKICLDAGHFAKYNHSPVNAAYWESDFNWKLHLYLKEELEKYNIEVITTREDKEKDLELADRGKASEGCDLFLSLHSNASTNPADDAPLACCTVTGKCNQLGLDMANLVADVMGTYQRGEIWNRYSVDWPGEDYYGVLRSATRVGTPAILLEHSYHTNLRATNWLLIDENVKKLAVAEGKFLAEHFGMLPKKEEQTAQPEEKTTT